MSVNIAKVQVKLDAVLSKNAQEICDAHVYLPRLGYPSNVVEAQVWLDKVSTLLTTIKTLNKTKVASARAIVYNQLCASCKQIVDSAYRSEAIQPCVADQDRVVAIRLYKFATEST